MKIYKEVELSSFEFWSGAKDFAEKLTEEEFNQVEAILEDTNPNGMSATEVNDLFWHDSETVAEWLGTTEEEILERE